jgi:nitrogen PTS system EIIA component
MDIPPYFDKGQVLLGSEASDKWALISSMIEALALSESLQRHSPISKEDLLKAVVDREEDRPTGLGNGFAFPHGRIKGFTGVGLCVAIPAAPIDFNAPDGKPAEIVVLMVVPENQPQVALKYMAQFARLISDPVEREVMLSLRDPEPMTGYITKRVLQTDTLIAARDIMRRPKISIHPDTPLREVTKRMHQHMLDTVAVVEEDQTLVGEITCELLFQLGMPHFFSQLKSVSFIDEFDPFVKYFEGEGGSLARDVMSTDFATVSEDATLLEIVFELSVKRRNKVHVVRNGKRVGVIDRILVLDRVINI